MQEAMKFIEEHKKRGERVYVHCKAGHGRAGAIGLCWMMHENKGNSAEQVHLGLGLGLGSYFSILVQCVLLHAEWCITQL